MCCFHDFVDVNKIARNNTIGSLWGAPNHCWRDTLQRKNYRRSLPCRQKWRNIFVDYLSISGYNKNIKNNTQAKRM